jgi:hypothetical protein
MPITVGRTLSNTTRDFLGTFRRELSAFPRAAVAACAEGLRTTALHPTFANELMKPRALFFQGLGAGDGNRTATYSLGRSST